MKKEFLEKRWNSVCVCVYVWGMSEWVHATCPYLIGLDKLWSEVRSMEQRDKGMCGFTVVVLNIWRYFMCVTKKSHKYIKKL